MTIKTTELNDLLLLTPTVLKDDRGYFMESYNRKKFEEFFDIDFVQDNESLSKKDVLRGLHFQKPPFAQAKLVRVIVGSIFDVAVDIRKNSATYGKYFGHVLSAENKKQLFIPEGFAHGFLSLEDNTIINYKCSDYYNKESEGSLLWNDQTLAIEWNCPNPILADKDKVAENFRNFESPF